VARLNDDAQWIILMGFLVSFSFFFLAMIINQSTVVGQTTAESVIEFPKNDIRDVRQVIRQSVNVPNPDFNIVKNDITVLSINRKGSVVDYMYFTGSDNVMFIQIHYNNGVTEYNENWSYR
jgi:beta-lactam-binding protein with PASTA domain